MQSNHPPSIIRQTATSIKQRITDLSRNAKEFYKTSNTCNKALKESGFIEQLVYKPREAQQKSRKNTVEYETSFGLIRPTEQTFKQTLGDQSWSL